MGFDGSYGISVTFSFLQETASDMTVIHPNAMISKKYLFIVTMLLVVVVSLANATV